LGTIKVLLSTSGVQFALKFAIGARKVRPCHATRGSPATKRRSSQLLVELLRRIEQRILGYECKARKLQNALCLQKCPRRPESHQSHPVTKLRLIGLPSKKYSSAHDAFGNVCCNEQADRASESCTALRRRWAEIATHRDKWWDAETNQVQLLQSLNLQYM
jgi:hypothetical protein